MNLPKKRHLEISSEFKVKFYGRIGANKLGGRHWFDVRVRRKSPPHQILTIKPMYASGLAAATRGTCQLPFLDRKLL